MIKIEADLISTIAGFSRAGDLNELHFLHHAERVAYISFRLGRKLQLTEEKIEELILSALLHDFGVMTTAEKLKLADLEPLKGITALHCQKGHELLKQTRLFGSFALNVLEHHDYYTPNMRLIPAIIHVADRLDLILKKDLYYLWQVDDVLSYFQLKKGSIFHPEVVDALHRLSGIQSFWLDLQHGNYYHTANEQEPFRRIMNLEELEEVAQLMALLVDSKSPFTADHSQGVKRIANFLAQALGMSQQEVRLIKIAALLHDLGKLAVADEILMHPGALNKKQRAVMKQHTYHTYHLIGTIGPGVEELQQWAAYHHEHLDGTGYPFGLEAAKLKTESRLIAVADITHSLLEDRPYRDALPKEKVIRILQNKVQAKHIDPQITDLTINHLNEIALLV